MIAGGQTMRILLIALIVLAAVVALIFYGLSDQLRLSAFVPGQTEEAQESPLPEAPKEEIDPQEALGFVDYPVVAISQPVTNPFLDDDLQNGRVYSEAEIQARCAFITIPFNRALCERAERACASVLESTVQHRMCMEDNGYFASKALGDPV